MEYKFSIDSLLLLPFEDGERNNLQYYTMKEKKEERLHLTFQTILNPLA